MIVFSQVNKKYRLGGVKSVQAVHDLSLTVAKGEVFGFIGPNGAGKSTTIKLLLNLARLDNGSIVINGSPCTETVSRAQLGYLPENPYLYDYLTATEFLAYSGRLSGMSRSAIREKTPVLLEKLLLSDAAHRKIGTFSKGMQQRTAIAAALIHNPEIVILDEPMSGLDPLGRKLVFDLINELKSHGRTVFISSHVLPDIERLCDRIGIIVRGKLSYEGKVSELPQPLEELFLKVVSTVGVGEVK